MQPGTPLQRLVSLPPSSAACFAEADPVRARSFFAASDPPGRQLGSAGGTVHLLAEAWRGAPGAPRSLEAWLAESPKLIIHGSGQSRRLPAYAAAGKPLVPVPILNSLTGQVPDQTLLDLQSQSYERLFWHAPASYRVMVTCGDVLLRNPGWTDPYPEADVLILGLHASPEEAQQHGVIVSHGRGKPGPVRSFLQKPSREELLRIEESGTYYLDTGVWLLGQKALDVLLARCGWDSRTGAFSGGVPGPYDLYGEFGPTLGTHPAVPDPATAQLTAAVLPLNDARFYHFGTNRSLLASVAQLQSPSSEQRSFGHASLDSHATPIVQNSVVDCVLGPVNRHVWIENSRIAKGWSLSEKHILTAVPDNDWDLALPAGACLDFAPLPNEEVCIRAYGFDDHFRGPLGAAKTTWFDAPVGEWFQVRGMDLKAAGLKESLDIQEAALFPVMPSAKIDPQLLQWMLARSPAARPDLRDLWLRLPRLSARDLLVRTDVVRLCRHRAERMDCQAAEVSTADWQELARRQDLVARADWTVRCGWKLPSGPDGDLPGLAGVHDSMFRYAVVRGSDPKLADQHQREAFQKLRQLLIGRAQLSPARPVCAVQEDQIVWGRAPVRLDLAGGWTDTPPYCLEHGGRVVNVSVDLNGQPPIQVFARICPEPRIVLRSIDLGIDETIRNYEELQQYGKLGSGFGIARAALALAGFEPRFHPEGRFPSLEKQLSSELGGGIELTMLAAVPKGSGLGTSSILAATLLGTLGELCGLNWSTDDLIQRTLTLEQMLTSGGGWQDQVGGLVGGLKLIETVAGLTQQPTIRGLPATFFGADYANSSVLLYYTGLTRVAHDILGEIVRGIFLNSAHHLGIVEEIGYNAGFASDVIQRRDWAGFCEAISRSWRLNQMLDRGTNPPQVQALLGRISDHLAAAKLLGAGGGGYLLMLAKDLDASGRIRKILRENPPNRRARFVDLQLSAEGLQVTRS